jgi:alpha-galactosidase-like protein
MKKTLWILAFSAIALLGLTFTIATNSVNAEVNKKLRKTPVNPNSRLQTLFDITQRMLKLFQKAQTADPTLRQSLINELQSLATSRRALMLELARQDANQVLQVALPDQILTSLPEELQSYFEQHVELDGELDVLYEENETESRLRHFLTTGSQRIELHFRSNSMPDVLSGSFVRVRGVRIDDQLIVDGAGDDSTGTTQSVQTLASIAPNTFGEQKVLVLLVNFQDKATQPWTTTQVRDVVFNSVNNFYRESSYGQTWLAGDVFGWYTLPISGATCDQNAIATYARQAATAAGINLSAYNRLVYAFPSLSCGWTGWGTYGGSPSQAWINGSMSVRTVGHELGHNFGIYHARALDCGSDVIGSTCSTIEYGDSWDILGQSGVVAHSHAAQKERLGWLGYGISPGLTIVQTSGTYWLDPYETIGSNPKALKILKSTDPTTGKKTWYYVEFRRPIGFDSFISSNSSLMNGVVVHTGTEGYSFDEYLLDMTPSTSSFSDGALGVGRSYTDPNVNVTITPVSVGDLGASVMVSFGPQPCVRGNPTITMSPSTSQWVSPGTTVNYNVSLTNNDTAGCVASGFELRANVPTGWSALFDTSSVTLSSGQSATTTLRVTSSTSTANGYYNIGVDAVNTGATNYAGSSSVTCAVMRGLDVTVVTDQASYTINQTALITATVTSGGTPISGASVAFTVTKPNGSTAKGTTTTSASGVASFKYRFNKQKDPAGVYSIAVGANLNGVIGSGSTSFSLK